MKYNFLSFFLSFFDYLLAMLGLLCFKDFSLVAASGSDPPGVVHGLLIAVASLLLEDKL